MPAQTSTRKTAYYNRGDTGPPLRQRLELADGSPIDLTDATTVTIRIGFASWSMFYSPRGVIVLDGPCTIEDQVASTGWVNWVPAANDLEPAGNYFYTFTINWNDGTSETVPPYNYLPMAIQEPVGGHNPVVF